MKFERLRRPHRNKADGVGRVVVSVQLREPGKSNSKPGNLTHTFSIKEARVSDVAEAIEEALFEQEDSRPIKEEEV